MEEAFFQELRQVTINSIPCDQCNDEKRTEVGVTVTSFPKALIIGLKRGYLVQMRDGSHVERINTKEVTASGELELSENGTDVRYELFAALLHSGNYYIFRDHL